MNPIQTSNIQTETAYYVGTSPYSYKPNELAEIIGVVLVTRCGEKIPCFHVRYSDCQIDYTPINVSGYKIVALEDTECKATPTPPKLPPLRMLTRTTFLGSRTSPVLQYLDGHEWKDVPSVVLD